MLDLNALIGLEMQEACKILEENGYNIKVIINSKQTEGCNKNLVCAIRQNGLEVTLICGEFLCYN